MAKAVLLLSLLTGCYAPRVWHLPNPVFCPVCGSRAHQIISSGPDDGKWRCDKRGHLYETPRARRVL